MKIRFQADADLDQRIITAIVRREPQLDFQTAVAASIIGLLDPAVLKIAAQEGRLLVSHDQTTMPHHFADFISNETSAGLIIVPQHLSIAIVVERLIFLWETEQAEQWVNRICYLPPGR